MVLQRAGKHTSMVSVYGLCGVMGRNMGGCDEQNCRCTFKPGSSVVVTLVSEGDDISPATIAPVNVVIRDDGSWKAMLPAQPAGGNWTVTATCSGCSAHSKSSNATTGSYAVLRSVTFGDVFFCSGQSNVSISILIIFVLHVLTVTVA